MTRHSNLLLCCAAIATLTALSSGCASHSSLPARQINAGEFIVSGTLDLPAARAGATMLYGTGNADFGGRIGSSFTSFHFSAIGRGYIGDGLIASLEAGYTHPYFDVLPLSLGGNSAGENTALYGYIQMSPKLSGALKPGQFLYAGAVANGVVGRYQNDQFAFTGVQAGGFLGVDLFNTSSLIGVQAEISFLPISVWDYGTSGNYQFAFFPIANDENAGPFVFQLSTSAYLRTDNEATPPPPSIEELEPDTPAPPAEGGEDGGAIPTDAPPPPPPMYRSLALQ